MENKIYTREEVITVIEKLLECGNLLIDAIQSENPKYDAVELLDIVENK